MNGNPDTELVRIVLTSCRLYRKGVDVVTHKASGPIAATEYFFMPHVNDAPENLLLVDCHFVIVGVDKAEAEKHRAYIRGILAPYVAAMKDGPSYIVIGDCFGSQDLALGFMAIGEALDFWHVVTPAKLGLSGPAADLAAGNGYVMTSGYNIEEEIA